MYDKITKWKQIRNKNVTRVIRFTYELGMIPTSRSGIGRLYKIKR